MNQVGDKGAIPSTFYLHGAGALLNAAAKDEASSRDGHYINFAYTLQEVVIAMRRALLAFHDGNDQHVRAQAVEFEKMSTARCVGLSRDIAASGWPVPSNAFSAACFYAVARATDETACLAPAPPLSPRSQLDTEQEACHCLRIEVGLPWDEAVCTPIQSDEVCECSVQQEPVGGDGDFDAIFKVISEEGRRRLSQSTSEERRKSLGHVEPAQRDAGHAGRRLGDLGSWQRSHDLPEHLLVTTRVITATLHEFAQIPKENVTLLHAMDTTLVSEVDNLAYEVVSWSPLLRPHPSHA